MTNKEEFIKLVKPGAIEGWEEHSILPSITIAQAILESAWGQSELATKANNLFGVKSSKDWDGEVYKIETWEVVDGKNITVEADFRKYPSQKDSVRDHGSFFTSTPWRTTNYKNVIGETDYKKVAQALSDAGYATDPAYPNKLINIVEQYDLQEIDKEAKVPVNTESGNTKGDNNMAKKRIGLDIGHGSNTFPGSGKGVRVNGVGYAEHTFNSKLALKIKALLEASGIEVVMIQKPFSNDVPLSTRTSWYAKQNLDAILSVHANAGTTGVSGRCSFAWISNSKAQDLAKKVIAEIKNKGYSTHGNGLHISQRGSWTNLHMTRVPSGWSRPVPSVLVEYGFMTNSRDFPFIFGSKQESYTTDMAEATAKGLCKFLGVGYKGGSVPTVTTPTTIVASKETHTVKAGDTLWAIASANGIEVDELKKLNNLNTNIIQPGQKLVVAVKEDKRDEVIVVKPKTYTIQSGDTLGEVANEFGVGLSDLVKWNNISDPDIVQVGQVIKLSSNATAPSYTSVSSPSLVVGEVVKIKSSASKYATGESIPGSVKKRAYTIMQTKSDRVLLQEIMSWVRKTDIEGYGASSTSSSVSGGSKVKIKSSASTYATGERIPSSIKGKTYTVMQTKSDRVLLKEIMSWVRKTDLVGSRTSTPKPAPSKSTSLSVGSKVQIKSSASKYATGQNIPNSIKGKTYTIMQTKSDRVLLKEIMSWVKTSDIAGAGTNTKTVSASKTTSFKVGDKVKVKSSASKYATGQNIPNSIKGKTYTIMQAGSGKMLLKEIMSWVKTSDLTK